MSKGLTLPYQAKLSTTENAFAIIVTDIGAISCSSFGTDQFGDSGNGVSWRPTWE